MGGDKIRGVYLAAHLKRIYTVTLYVMVTTIVKGGGNATPILTSLC
jgi:hypothetical protein